MKLRTFTALTALLGLPGLNLAATEAFTLETRVYVYRNSDFGEVQVPGATFASPATARFGGETLALDGADFTWSGGRNPPARFSLTETPAVVLPAGKPVTLWSAEPVQFLEPAADGTLQVREIAGDSPDAPHCRLRFTVAPVDGTGGDLRVSCDLELATLVAREKVSGVKLEVGKPVLARTSEKLEPVVRAGAWSAVHAPAPAGGDYSLLVLFKVVPGAAVPVAATATKPADGPMSAADLDAFVTHYYRQPRPERIAAVIAALGPSGFIKEREQVFIGFFAGVFGANPDRVQEWRQLARRQDKPVRDVVSTAFEFRRPGSVLGASEVSVRQNDRTWGVFFATGDPACLQRLAGHLRLLDESDRGGFWSGATAMWSLARNAPAHPSIRPILERIRPAADPRTRELIDELLAKDPESIRRWITSLADKRPGRPAMTINGVPGGGMRDMGDYGPVSPNHEMGQQRP